MFPIIGAKMKDFILNLIQNRAKKIHEEHGNTSAGTITAMVKREFKPTQIRGLFWEVRRILDELVADRIIINTRKGYLPAEGKANRLVPSMFVKR